MRARRKDAQTTQVQLAEVIVDGLVKSPKSSVFVIPAKAGIQDYQVFMDPRFRGGDGLGNFLRDHQYQSEL